MKIYSGHISLIISQMWLIASFICKFPESAIMVFFAFCWLLLYAIESKHEVFSKRR